MPPAIIVNKEMILQAAFEIAKSEGLSSVSARKIADFLNCSTKPIYREFTNMEQLEQELIQKISAYALTYILNYNETEFVYYNIGLGYLSFAEKEKELYKILFLSNRKAIDFMDEKYILGLGIQIERMKKDPFLSEFNESKLKELFSHMFIFTHGISSMIACDSILATQEQIREMINAAFWSYVEFMRK